MAIRNESDLYNIIQHCVVVLVKPFETCIIDGLIPNKVRNELNISQF